jgi:phosphoglycolate/pyridoxal phosphate phosphatase family enzyme
MPSIGCGLLGWLSSENRELVTGWFGVILFSSSIVVAMSIKARRSSARKTQRLTATAFDSLLNGTDIFIFDCDGVVWKGDCLIDGAHDCLWKLHQANKKVFFMTNNSILARSDYLQKFHRLGLCWVLSDQILCSAFAAVIYFQKCPLSTNDKKVFVIGQSGIVDELTLAGIPFIGGPDFSDNCLHGAIGKGKTPKEIVHDPDVEAVLVGFDSAIDYDKIQYAQLCLNNNHGCRFVATNTDSVKHITPDQEWAGSGAMVGAIAGCTLQAPIVTGKPSSWVIDFLCEKFDIVDRGRVCMIGDRLDTDMLFGLNNHLSTILTLSGCTLPTSNWQDDVVTPHFVVDSIRDFFALTTS